MYFSITSGWDRVVDWIDPAPHQLQAAKLPGLILPFVVGFAVGHWLRARDRKK